MAEDIGLLWKLRADNSQAKATLADTRNAVASLRTSSSSELNQLQGVATAALGKITQSFTQVTGQVPVFGNAINALGSSLSAMSAETTGAGASIAAIAGPIGIAVVAVGALAGGSAILVKSLFELAQQAADFRGKLFDMSQQLGISVETLSALEIIAKTTGGSIEGISASLGIFQKHLEDAQDPTDKTARLFKQLGVETSNTEDALRQTLTALAKMPEGFHQTATALELFGRGGKSILAILKEMDGDLDGAIAKFREMGLIVSTEDARAADQFNDQLAVLQFQFRGLLGKEVIPAALSSLKDLAKFLKDNREAISTLGQAIGSFASVVSGVLKASLSDIALRIQQVNGLLTIQAALFERIARAIGLIKPTDFSAATGGIGASAPPELGGDATASFPGARRSGSSGGARVAAGKSEAQRELERQLAAYQQLQAELKRAVDALSGLDTSTREYAVAQEIANGSLEKASQGLQELALDSARRIDQIAKERKLTEELNEFQEHQNTLIKIALEGEQSFSEQTEALIDSLEKQGKQLSVSEIFWLRFNTAILQAVGAMEKAIAIEEKLREQQSVPLVGGVEGDGSVQPGFDSGLGGPPGMADTTDAFGSLGRAMSDALGLGQEIGDFFGDTLANTFGHLAQAVGEAVQAFVLFGNAGGGLRKFTATLISEIAKMAAVQAVWELAQGLAMLALNFFWPDPKLAASAAGHFHAAAIYGSIAAIAAGAGRVVAGGSFQEAAGGAGGSGSPNQGRNPSDAGRPVPIDVDRAPGGGGAGSFSHVLEFKVKGDVVVDHFERDYMLNGRTRVIITSDGQSR